MGYSLEIGEPYVEVEKEDNLVTIEVKEVKLEDAPAFDEPTDFTNSRWPSYSGWSDFCTFVGLYDMFFDKEKGLISEHPGVFPVLPLHKEKIDKAMLQFKRKYPNAIAGYSDKPGWPEANSYLVRLEWLKYWIDWSLINCKQPVFKNT